MALSNEFTPRLMLQTLREFPQPTSFLRQLFVGGADQITNKKVISIDKVAGNDIAAGYVSRQGGPHVVGKKGYDRTLHVAPYIFESEEFTPGDADVIPAGTQQYGDVGTAGDVAAMIGAGLQDLNNRITRKEEAQIAEALTTGKLLITGKDVDYIVDYGMKTAHKVDVSSTGPWGTASTDILGQLSTWAGLIEDTGAPSPTDLCGGAPAMRALLKNTAILKYLDIKNMDIGNLMIKNINGQRASYLGRLTWPGVDIRLWSYQAGYTTFASGSAVKKRYVADTQVILGSKSIASNMVYAKIENFKVGNFMGKRFPLLDESDNGKLKTLTIEASPLYVLKQPNGIVTAKIG